MAFTGVATVTKVADDLFRITGLSLAASAAGTIGFAAGTSDAEITAPDWIATTGVSLIDAINVVVNRTTAAAATAVPPRITKAGATQALFQATVTNDDGAAASGTLEIYVQFKS